jgi:hypothetical protein
MPSGLQPRSIAHEDIRTLRARKKVPVGPGGVLHDYVPFYFGERSPMLYANHVGKVLNNQSGQKPLIYLVSTVNLVRAHTFDWVFTDGHAVRSQTRFFDDVEDLDQVDWDAVGARYWANPPALKRRKQSEFLVLRFMPIAAIKRIVVLNEESADATKKILAAAKSNLPVRAKPDWYY